MADVNVFYELSTLGVNDLKLSLYSIHYNPILVRLIVVELFVALNPLVAGHHI